MSEPDAGDYGSYLRLDLLLAAQQPLSEYHDELVFIVGHQAAELWMKVVVDELSLACRRLGADHVGSAARSLGRVVGILDLLAAHSRVLATITPTDYAHFARHLPRVSSGEGVQPAAIDLLLGRRGGFSGRAPDEQVYLGRIAEQPSVYDAAVGVLGRRGLAPLVERDWTEVYEPSPAVTSAWETVYSDPPRHWDLYELAERLIDVAHATGRWVFEQRALALRMRGEDLAGGASLPVDLFPELWGVRSGI